MKFECPHCRQHLESADLSPDSEVSCPSCGSTFCPAGRPDAGPASCTQDRGAPVTTNARPKTSNKERLIGFLAPLLYIFGFAWLCWATYILVTIKNQTDSCASGRQVSDLEIDIRRVKSEVSSIASGVSSIESDISSIESDISGIESDVTTIEREVTSKSGYTLRATVESIENR